METRDTIFTRHSIRTFRPEPIPKAILEDILEAGRLAPSAQNRQPWRFIVIQGEDKVKSLSVNCGLIGLANFFIRTAPCVIIACADTKKATTINAQDYYLVDTAIAFQQMMLMAWDHGIGSCWLAAYSEQKLQEWLDLPKFWRIVGISPFGYPAEKKSIHAKLVGSFAKSADRLPLSEIVQYY